MKRLLFVMMSLDSGGAEKSLVNLLNELPKEKYEIDLLLFRKRGPFLKQVPPHIKICEVPSELKKLYGNLKESKNFFFIKIFGTIISKMIEKDPSASSAYRWKHFYSKYIKQYSKEYDVAFAYMTGETTFYTLEKIKAKRKLCFVHNDYRAANHPKKYDYEYFKKIDGIASISDICCDVLKEEFPEFEEKIYCIPNITSSLTIKKQILEFNPTEYKSENIILSIGRLMEQKGFDMAVEAASILKKRGIKFQWFIIGEGYLREKLESLIKEKDVYDCIFLLGIRENPYPYINKAKIFVQTSLYEGKSVVLDEAKILGKPIVVTNYPTVKDQILNNKEGIIVGIDSKGIADGIEKMLTDFKLYSSIRKYLSSQEYGNEKEIEKYYRYIEGK